MCAAPQVWSLPALEHYVALREVHPERTIMNHKLADTMVRCLGRSGRVVCPVDVVSTLCVAWRWSCSWVATV